MTSIADPDYWSLLGLAPDSDQDQLKRAFRREARRWHPDLNGNDPVAEERFKLVNEAYAVLSDPRRRADWERGQHRPASLDPFAEGFPTFEDYLDVVLGVEVPSRRHEEPFDRPEADEPPAVDRPVASPASPPPVRAVEDLESEVVLTPEQALHGTTVEVSLPDGLMIELETPPLAGDGWRLRLEGVAPGGRDHFLHLRVVTDEGLRIDGLRVHYRLELFPPTLLSAVPLTSQPSMGQSPFKFLRGPPVVVSCVCAVAAWSGMMAGGSACGDRRGHPR